MTAQPVHILLVDDDLGVLELTGEILATAGHRTTQVTSAQAALDLIAAGHRFDVVMTDHSMPGLSGEELILRLRQLVPDTRCLLVSGARSR